MYAVFKDTNGNFKFAPVFPDNIKNLPRESREKLGWYDLEAIPPEVDEKHIAVIGGYERTDFGYRRIYVIEPIVEDKNKKYSTLSIKRELAAMGKWDAAKELLTANGYWDDYALANYLSETDEVFKTACAAFVQSGLITQTELAELLSKCVWTAE